MPALLRVTVQTRSKQIPKTPMDYTFVRRMHHLRRRMLDEVARADLAIGDSYLPLRDARGTLSPRADQPLEIQHGPALARMRTSSIVTTW